MGKKYAISDIHGCLKTFVALLKRLEFSTNDELYGLGDLIDRGPDSKGVMDHIMHLQDTGYVVHCIRGNHDQLMLNARHDRDDRRKWMLNGGRSLMDSFNAMDISDIPKLYFDFLDSFPYYMEVEDYILVHAGFKFALPDPFQETKAMLWQRSWYPLINYGWLGDRTILHGHTPLTKGEIKSMHKQIDTNQYLNIDCGCVFSGRRIGVGYLACFCLDDKSLIFEANVDYA